MVCRRCAPSSDLQRVGWHEVRGYFVGHGVGRGAWCCRAPQCAESLSASQLRRAWRRDVSDDDVALVTQLLVSDRVQPNREL